MLSLELDQVQLASSAPTVPPRCRHTELECRNDCWKKYPQSRFPNWTPSQVSRSKIEEALVKKRPCTIYQVDIDPEGHFSNGGEETISENNQFAFWGRLIKVCRNGHTTASVLRSPCTLGNNIELLVLERGEKKFSASTGFIPSRPLRSRPTNAWNRVRRQGRRLLTFMSKLKCLASLGTTLSPSFGLHR